MSSNRLGITLLLGSSLWMLSACFPINGSESVVVARSIVTTPVQDPRSPILLNPQVGDIYAAELTHFSEGDFGGELNEPMYGLMKVIHVGRDSITIVTENDAWPDRKDAIVDLHRHLDDVTWEPDEQVRVPREKLIPLLLERHILDARRLSYAGSSDR